MNTMNAQMIIIISLINVPIDGQLYEETHAIFKTLFNPSNYHPQIRPVSNQSEAVHVNITFGLLSIVAIDDADESFTSNAYITSRWKDQRLIWNPSDYGNQNIIHPRPTQVWRPQALLVNTMDKRDPFAEDLSILKLSHDGIVHWSSGSLFTTSCSLDLEKYPFDEQMCAIKMFSLGLDCHELRFIPTEPDMDEYTINGEWRVVNVSMNAAEEFSGLSNFEIRVHLKRRPTFYVLNVIVPFVFLSFLNLLAFIIPQETGEKIGYSITVLLALSVFFSIIDGMLPRSSKIVPFVVIYLFSVYVLSALTVIDSILIGYIYYVQEKKARHEKMKEKLKTIIMKMKKPMRNRSSSCSKKEIHEEKEKPSSLFSEYSNESFGPDEKSASEDSKETDGKGNTDSRNNKVLAATVDFYSSVLFMTLWAAATSWFFLSALC